MICPACGYAMDAFDKECARCQGKGLAKPVAPAPAAAAAQSTPAPAVPTPKPQVKFADQDAIERLCGVGFMGGLAACCYFFLFYDVSVDAGSFGRVNNIGLMAQRQNGIILGLGIAILSVIVYFVVQNKVAQNSRD